jgi:hypothetical protein
MQVKIETTCGRCGKKEEKSVSLEEAQRLESMEAERGAAAAELSEILNSTLGRKHPDLIILYRDKEAEKYAVESMSNLCSIPDAKRNRGCEARVISLLKDIYFRDQPKKPSKPKKEPGPKPPKNDKKKNGQDV